MRVLLATQPGSGHWHPLVPLARALDTAGHEVAFATAPGVCAAVTAQGFRCHPVGLDESASERRSRRDRLMGLPAEAQAVFFWTNVFAGSRAERALPDLLALLTDWRPDLLVREDAELASALAAEHFGIPQAVVQVTAWRPHLRPLIAPPLDRLRLTVGLPPDPDLSMFDHSLLLVPGPPGYADLASPLPPTAHLMRPVLFDHSGEEELPAWVDHLPPTRPTVYATLGTVSNHTPGIIDAILVGLAAEPISLIVTVGRDQDPADFGPQPAHVKVERYIPQSLLFPRVDLVVTHGGSGTVMAAFSHGLPMVIVPIAADQPDNAWRCADLGVARVIDPADRSPAAFRAAVRAVLGDPSYRRRAERLRQAMLELPGPAETVARLEGFMKRDSFQDVGV